MLQIPTINTRGLKVLAGNHLQGVDLSPIDRAWDIVEEVHQGEKHFSGEPYILHSLEVASTLASMKLDLDTILSGLLHGVLKHGVTTDELREKFGASVAQIVDGSTKITDMQYNSKLAHQAENVRKMLLAIASDVRVLLVKLADRLQDMCVLEAVDREKQREVAGETMDLYAPLAGRLGIDWMKRELEDLAFKFLHTDEFAELSRKLESSLEERQIYVDEVIGILNEKLHASGIKPTRIIGRPKHLYSIYKKLIVQNIPLEHVYDKVAFRIIVNSLNECYEALGTIHANWAPVPGRIKDFISVPKSNNYQSMHTTVIGPRGHFIEIQIRTEQMDLIAQEGVAAHWAYKEGQKAEQHDMKLFRELKKLVVALQEVEDPKEFLDSVRGELYDPDVYALTPNGEVKEFPKESCPIDFAYAIHSEVGDHCTGAKVNGRLVPLKYQLQNGDIVEIITSPSQTPRRGWLNLVKTSRARSRIRSWLRREEKEKALKLGREICERELKKNNTTLKKMVKSGHIRLLLKQLHCNSLDDMLVKVGSGTITVQHLEKFLLPTEVRQEKEAIESSLTPAESGVYVSTPRKPAEGSDAIIQIDGIDDMLVKISQCCNPVPGDDIIGFITMGRGVSVHKADCLNLKQTDPLRWIDVSWSNTSNRQHRVELLVSAENKRGIFAEISAAISSDNANIVEISAHTTPVDTADIRITVEVENLEHLQIINQHLRQMTHVISVRRK
ncbi:RelA/SpoT family protein [Desulfopila inferna]|uniref:RelA/SpoT family protein n=1 Tax=Desulfopila inferna TaxID=468528 RepID=UPI0019627EBB|nr:bifunctional (p)ppGpp synthetase/guanosine-3',5'-bis(diphosphate) 3'-pyrophosphohydrolase [Desulfopila inferna]MBM9605394.1 bifunctional (p)ppGpp synthetase/guanosine-3',5'-bis(diphosphate) 3'-pyrophosphohydrolase [Desulfopila inferna]